ncbi:MAG TPA: hypothetical protein VFF68_01045, partial [Anaerolineaceae bacterium]|nr:hypothetical protein [Anaerolineaceae bacterium]
MPRRPPTDVMETAVAIYQPTADLALSSSIMALNFAFEERARELVISATNGLGYTNAEITAMTKLEQLKLINGMDLAAIYMRHAVIRQIREGSLFSMHPENFNSDKAMAQAAGISGS